MKRHLLLSLGILLCGAGCSRSTAIMPTPQPQPLSASAAIGLIQNQFPELKDYPSDNLPPRSVKSEKASDGWYVAFVQEGSGVSIIEARCFEVKDDQTFTERKYAPQGTVLTGEFSAKACGMIGNVVGGDRDVHGCIGSAGYSWCQEKQKCLRAWEEPCQGNTDATLKCAVENCHGMDIKCGPNPAEVCTAMYAMGDKCLQYAKCGIQDGQCQQLSDTRFIKCKICVQACIDANKDDVINAFDCESKCN